MFCSRKRSKKSSLTWNLKLKRKCKHVISERCWRREAPLRHQWKEMGETSQAFDVYKRNSQVDLASALRGSISFGRFLSETLDWEKWSVFCHNKHLEEAKSCSIPGSVAQKKAYFESHYRRAALKSATVLEPENGKQNSDSSGSPTEDDRPKTDDSSWMETEIEEPRNERHLRSAYKSEENHGLERMEGSAIGEEIHGERSLQVKSNIVPSIENHGLDRMEGSAIGKEVHVEHSLQVKSNLVPSIESEPFASDNVNRLQAKEPPKEISINNHQNKEQNKKILTASGLKSNYILEDSGISYSYASRFWKSIAKENKPPQSCMATSIKSSERRKVASGSLHMSNSFMPVQVGQKPSLENKVLPIFEKVGDSKAGCTTPSRASGHRYSHIKTPAKAPISGGPEHTISTPQTEHKRIETPSYVASSGRKLDAKLCSPSINCFKSPNAKVKKEYGGGSASSSCKINEKHAENEIRKLRQNYCFKARPLPDFYHNTKSPEVELKKHNEREIRKLRQNYFFKARPLPDFNHNPRQSEPERKNAVSTSASPSFARRNSKQTCINDIHVKLMKQGI